jgi:serine/threonine protein kinase
MSPTSHPDPDLPRADESTGPVADQKTVLLSEVAEYSAPEPRSSALPTLNASLSAAALAALSQRYDILAEAGHGSMGNVYKARDRETGETVALKLLKPEIASDQAMMDRFKNELLFARKITHKNICRVHEFNRIGGVAYTSMEFVEGESLRSALNRFGGFPSRKAIDLAQQMCSGLKEAHAQGIVHRDLKPENVMIDELGNIKIMDFGIARSMEIATRLTGSMVGTPAYMAPEQVAGKPVDYRTDVYSLGLILYEMFTGTQAFRADNAVALALKQMQENPRPPHEIEPNIPAAMERVILKCMEKEPARRFQTIAELEMAVKLPGTATQEVRRAPALDLPVPAKRYVSQVTEPAPPRSHSVIGLIFAWLLLLAALGFAGYAGWHWLAPVAWPDAFSFPQGPPAPKIPDFALDSTPAPDAAPLTPPSATPSPSESALAPDKATASKPTASAGDAAEFTPDATPAPTEAKAAVDSAPGQPAARKSNPLLARSVVSSESQQRASNNSGENANAVVDAVLSGMIWVGRYERRDRADAAAKEIRDLGLSAIVVPRDGTRGQFFVVLTGPFTGKKLTDTTALLQADGFANARPVQSMEGNSPAKVISNRRQNQGADQQP